MFNIPNLILVFIGGGLGSVLRYVLGLYLNKSTLPYGTLTANVVGSLLIGVFMGFHFKNEQHYFSQTQIAFFVVGLLGGFTTFSSFMYENLQLLYHQQYMRLIGYSFLSLWVGFLMVMFGYFLGRHL